jgi:hypothetical protein
MRPKKDRTIGESDLFRARLNQIKMKHELVQLTGKIDWGEVTRLYENGRLESRPASLIALLLFKHI